MRRTVSLAVAAATLLIAPALARAELLTFDSITTLDARGIPVGYGGLVWSNFWVANASQLGLIPSGYENGLVSPAYVAFNPGGNPATMSVAAGSTFTLNSGYFTGAWNDGLQIEAIGTLLGGAVFDKTFTVDTSGPSFETFGGQAVDSVEFIATGGTNHGYNGQGTYFALDNLTINAVPEPGTLGLSAFGAVAALVVGRVRRGRRQG